MPIIALPRRRELGPAAAPVLDRERRPTLNTAPIQQGLSQFNDSNRMPQMSPEAAAAPYEALGSVGRAIVQAGGVVGALAIKRQEAENDIAVARAEERMGREYASFEAWKAERPNAPESWEPEWSRRLQVLQQELGGSNQLHSDARQAIELRMIRWSGQSSAGVAKDATKQTFSLAKSYTLSEAEEAIRTQNKPRFEAAKQAGLSKGYIFPHDATYLEGRYKDAGQVDLENGVSAALDNPNREQGLATAKRLIAESGDLLRPAERTAKLARIDATHGMSLEKDQFQAAVLTDPKKAAADLEDATKWPRITGGDRAAALVQAKRMQAELAGDAFRDIRTRIDLGQVKADETFEGPGMEQLTQIQRDVLKAMNADKTRVASMNNPADFQRASTAIDLYTPAEGDDLARANFEAYLELSFSGPHLEKLREQWKARTETGGEASLSGEAFKALDKWAFDDQRMGQYKVPETDKEGRQLQKKEKSYITTPGWLWGENTKEVEVLTPEWKEDPLKRDAVAREVSAIKEKIRNEIKKGDLLDSAAVWKRMSQLSKMPLSGQSIGEAAASGSPSSALLTPSSVPVPPNLGEEALNIIQFKAAK